MEGGKAERRKDGQEGGRRQSDHCPQRSLLLLFACVVLGWAESMKPVFPIISSLMFPLSFCYSMVYIFIFNFMSEFLRVSQ